MTPPALLASALSNRYRIERELGQGGMATVYLAHDLKHNRQVAIKVLHPELAHSLGPERFLREITITAQFDHPYILPLLDSGVVEPPTSEGRRLLYYVMPYVSGESLRVPYEARPVWRRRPTCSCRSTLPSPAVRESGSRSRAASRRRMAEGSRSRTAPVAVVAPCCDCPWRGRSE
jgi:serine/threonine protein kinase